MVDKYSFTCKLSDIYKIINPWISCSQIYMNMSECERCVWLSDVHRYFNWLLRKQGFNKVEQQIYIKIIADY